MDSSAHNPAHIINTDYVVGNTYYLAPYFGPFEAHLMPKSEGGSKGVPIYQNDRWIVALNSRYLQSTGSFF